MGNKLALGIPVCDDYIYLAPALESVASVPVRVVFLSELDWNGNEGDWKTTERIALDCGAEVVRGRWTSEEEHRAAMHGWILAKNFDFLLLQDSDELYSAKLLGNVLRFAEEDLVDRLYVNWETAWHQPDFWIRPREQFTPIVLVNLRRARYIAQRGFEGGRGLLLNDAYNVIWHQSYSGGLARIEKKVTSWGHKNEVVEDWLTDVYRKWPDNKLLRNLHPTQPDAYRFAEHVHLPEELLLLLRKGAERLAAATGRPLEECFELMAPGLFTVESAPQKGPVRPGAKGSKQQESRTRGVNQNSEPQTKTPAKTRPVTFIIPLHGGPVEIRACMESLRRLSGGHQIVVVDNASPDDALKVAEQYVPDKIVRFKENRGFAAACNEGAKHAKHDILVFLNSDTAVPEAGLRELVKSLTASSAIAAAGPYTNNAAYEQQVDPAYTNLENLDLFAEDFSRRPVADKDRDMLVGFCLAVRKAAFEEIGGFRTEFGLGMWEDNALVYTLRRETFRAVLSGKSYIHHEGSKTLQRMGFDVRKQLKDGEAIFRRMFQLDGECGFSSHLSGLSPEPIQFNPARKPETLIAQVREFATHLKIGLYMIVKNEERCLADFLRSAKPYFFEIGIVDTGSTDRTKEIARSFGCKIADSKWNDSFAEARNESFKLASGAKWGAWADADDVIPFKTGEELIQAIANAPRDVCGVISGTEFLDGTVVDHVKVARMHPGILWTGRIHERWLPSLAQPGCTRLIRIQGNYRHENYDGSPEGQARKFERDMHLLNRSLEDDPQQPYIFFCLGMTLNVHQDHEQAIYWLRRSIDEGRENETFTRKSYYLWATSLTRMERKEEALVVVEKGLAHVPGDPELHFIAGQLYTDRGCLVEARDHFIKTTQTDTDSFFFGSYDRGILTFKSFHHLGIVEMLVGDYKAAKALWIQAMNEAPQWPGSAKALFHAALDSRDFPTARDMQERLLALEGFSENWVELTMAYAKFLGEPRVAFDALQAALQQDRFALAPRIALADALLSVGDDRAAASHFVVLQELGDARSAFALGEIDLKRGRREEAKAWFERALVLNPGHEGTMKRLEELS